MPENDDFILEILVGTTPLPEYEKDGQYYVESNLSTPFSYTAKASDTVQGETEVQSWPVTPYSLRLSAKPTTDTYYYRVCVDGVKVKGLSLEAGQSRVIEGFKDGGCLREFLFSLPRFASDENDRIEQERVGQIGVISVECWNAILKNSQYGLRTKLLDFQQANKKDSTIVTQGQHVMATSKAGKVLGSRSLYRSVDSWKLQSLRSHVQVRYHMGHTLQEMGFTLIPVTWSKTHKRRTKSKDRQDLKKLKRNMELIAGTSKSQTDGSGSSSASAKVKSEIDQLSGSSMVVDLTLESDDDNDDNDDVRDDTRQKGRKERDSQAEKASTSSQKSSNQKESLDDERTLSPEIMEVEISEVHEDSVIDIDQDNVNDDDDVGDKDDATNVENVNAANVDDVEKDDTANVVDHSEDDIGEKDDVGAKDDVDSNDDVQDNDDSGEKGDVGERDDVQENNDAIEKANFIAANMDTAIIGPSDDTGITSNVADVDSRKVSDNVETNVESMPQSTKPVCEIQSEKGGSLSKSKLDDVELRCHGDVSKDTDIIADSMENDSDLMNELEKHTSDQQPGGDTCKDTAPSGKASFVSPDVFDSIGAEKGKLSDLNTTFDSQESFVSVDYESGSILNSSAASIEGLDKEALDQAIDPTVQPTGKTKESKTTDKKIDAKESAVPESADLLSNSEMPSVCAGLENVVEPTVQPTTEAQGDKETVDPKSNHIETDNQNSEVVEDAPMTEPSAANVTT